MGAKSGRSHSARQVGFSCQKQTFGSSKIPSDVSELFRQSWLLEQESRPAQQTRTGQISVVPVTYTMCTKMGMGIVANERAVFSTANTELAL
jgi:hypothetical protein